MKSQQIRNASCFVIVLIACTLLAGCGGSPQGGAVRPKDLGIAAATAKVQGVNLNNAIEPIAHDQPIILAAAKGEWTNFAIQTRGLPNLPAGLTYKVRFGAPGRLNAGDSIASGNFRAYQILSLPTDVNRAGFVRHTGLAASNRPIPRALFPLKQSDGQLDLAQLRDPQQPTNAATRASLVDPQMLWVDLRVPTGTAAGEYSSAIEVIATNGKDASVVASAPLRVTVYDFVIPEARHLVMVSSIDWQTLRRLYPHFETVEPRLMNRADERYKKSIHTIDQLITLAQEHRVQVVVPRLQPTVKWPAARAPQVDWSDYDLLVGPWLSGDMFADKVSLPYWPMPQIDFLNNYPARAREEYWSEIASHFSQKDWINRSAVFLEKQTPGRASAADAIALSIEAQRVLSVNPDIRVSVPLTDDQLVVADANKADAIGVAEGATGRIFSASPSLVFSTPAQGWPENLTPPLKWLRTDLPGLIPYVGAGGDERDIRLWAWLSFLRNVRFMDRANAAAPANTTLVQFTDPLPRTNSPLQPADPNELVWFYPGEWFNTDEPVPTIQLKNLRRAQQDFEYLFIAFQRGVSVNASLMSRLITKPVEITPGQLEDPTYALLSGTADSQAWVDAKSILARDILLHEPGVTPDPTRVRDLNQQLLRWAIPQERPTILGRTTMWLHQAGNQPGQSLDISLRVGIDVYNASDSRPDKNLLQWTKVSPGWQVRPQRIEIDSLATYRVQRFTLDAQIDPERVRGQGRIPQEIVLTNGYDNSQTSMRITLPVATSDRRAPGLVMNGSLEDWTADDALQDGPLTRMFNRPAIQKQELQLASTSSAIYSGWSDDHFYLAFKVDGIVQGASIASRNDVDYQFRRAWGEDLCQVLVQPVYKDHSLGPVLHIAVKPNGSAWIERKTDSRSIWQPFEGAGVRYSATADGPTWRGEAAIPWTAIGDPAKGRPVLLRFNFTQHRHQTGESASWAGPIDFGRDDAFMGAIFIRDPQAPGMINGPVVPGR